MTLYFPKTFVEGPDDLLKEGAASLSAYVLTLLRTDAITTDDAGFFVHIACAETVLPEGAKDALNVALANAAEHWRIEDAFIENAALTLLFRMITAAEALSF